MATERASSHWTSDRGGPRGTRMAADTSQPSTRDRHCEVLHSASIFSCLVAKGRVIRERCRLHRINRPYGVDRGFGVLAMPKLHFVCDHPCTQVRPERRPAYWS